MRKIFTVVAALMLCATASAQEFRSAISNVPGNEYPKVSNDMRAIVRYTSKTAQKVQVQVLLSMQEQVQMFLLHV